MTQSMCMPRRTLALAATSLAISVLAQAQPAWPTQPVRIAVPTAPGTSPDITARLYAEGLATRWGVPVTVENRPGAGGAVAAEYLTQQRDGHALMLTFIGVLTAAPLLYAKLPFNPAEIAPVSVGAADALVLVTPKTPSYATLAEAVASFRSQPGKLNYATGGSDDYLAMVSFVRGQGLQMEFIAYRSSVLAIPDLTQGRVHLLLVPLAAALPQARAGTLQMLAVTNSQRAEAAPEVPTVAEAGFPDMTFQPTLVFLAPAAMPAALRERIAGDVRAVAGAPGFAEKLKPLGMAASTSTPEALGEQIATVRQHWTERARTYGVQPAN